MTADPVLDRNRSDGSAPTTNWSGRAALIAGGIAVALGGAVLAGWYTHTVALIQVQASLVPMQYNTALGFILCGASLLMLASGRARLASLAPAFAALAATIGFLTLFEYAFGIQLGIDQLFMQHYITVNTPHPGRMAPTTAASFALVGGGLIGLSRSKRASRGPLIARVIAAVIVTLAMTTLVAYAISLPVPFAWVDLNFTLMGVHTAAGFLFLGTGLFLQALPQNAKARPEQPSWLPYAVAAVGLSLAMLSWQQLMLRQDARIRRVIAAEVNSLRSVVEGQVQSRVDALTRISQAWELHGGTVREDWESFAARHAELQPDYMAITLTDTALQPRWSVRADETTEVELADIFRFVFGDDRRSVLNNARDRGQSTVLTEVFDPGPEDAILNFYMPLFPDGEFGGVFLVSYRLEGLVEQVDAMSGARDLEFVVLEGSRELFGRFDAERKHDEDWGQEVLLSPPHLSWRLRAWPSPDRLAELTTRLPELVTSGLVFLALLFSFTVGFAQVARRRSVTLQKITRQLKRDIAARSQIAQALQESEIRFRSVADSALDAMIFSDAAGVITYWNNAAINTFGYTEEEALGQPLAILVPEEFRDAHRAGFAQFISTGVSANLGQRLVVVGLKSDGSTFPLEVTLTSWTSSGIITIAAVARDMSKIREAEAALQQTVEQLADSNAELTHFNNLAVGRELRMIELKREINQILEETGKPAAYDVSFSPTVGDVTDNS